MKKLGWKLMALLGVASLPSAMDVAQATTPRPQRSIAAGDSRDTLFQKAWDNPEASRPEHQTAPGYARYEYRADRIIRLDLREAMSTSVRFPENETIDEVFVSDPNSFEAAIPRANVIIIRAIHPNVDANVTAFGQSGRLYQFYVRSQPTNNSRLPDLMVDIIVRGLPTNHSVMPSPSTIQSPPGTQGSSGLLRTNAGQYNQTVEADWLRRIGFRPENVVHDLSIMIPEGDSAGVVPERVFRDGQFTYIDYGANADALNEWPVASLIVQGKETPVNTRTAGPNGRMLIVEAIGDIMLRNGQKFVQIRRNANPATPEPPRRGRQKATRNLGSRTELGADPMLYQPGTRASSMGTSGFMAPPPTQSPADYRRYRIEVGTGTRRELQALWDQSRRSGGAFLNATGSIVEADNAATPGVRGDAAEGENFVLQIGPFLGMAEAMDACRYMEQRNRSCSVVAN